MKDEFIPHPSQLSTFTCVTNCANPALPSKQIPARIPPSGEASRRNRRPAKHLRHPASPQVELHLKTKRTRLVQSWILLLLVIAIPIVFLLFLILLLFLSPRGGQEYEQEQDEDQEED